MMQWVSIIKNEKIRKKERKREYVFYVFPFLGVIYLSIFLFFGELYSSWQGRGGGNKNRTWVSAS